MSLKKTSTFESFWAQNLEPKAKAHGVVDGDLSRIRGAVKNLLISAGWATVEGAMTLSSDKDAANCLTAAAASVDATAPFVAAERKVVRVSAGSTPTKGMLRASADGDSVVDFASQTTVNPEFPVLASVGDACPRCKGSMEPVALANNKAAVYCNRDRVVLPLPANLEVRY